MTRSLPGALVAKGDAPQWYRFLNGDAAVEIGTLLAMGMNRCNAKESGASLKRPAKPPALKTSITFETHLRQFAIGTAVARV